jgi:hypothetical protein
MGGVKSDIDGHKCINGVSLPECKYYPETGKVENDWVLDW